MPKVPRGFIEHPKIKHVLSHTINEFAIEEQVAIFFYCFLDLSVGKIATATELSKTHVISVLGLYSEKLKFKLGIFKKAVPYDASDLLPVSELLVLEL